MAKKNKKSRIRNKRPKTNSNVSEKILVFWKSKFVWGDATRIQLVTGLSRPTIKSAFDGRATDTVIEKITNYYLNQNGDGKN